MAKFEDMIEEVLMTAHGYGGANLEVVGTLHAAITDSATTFQVDGTAFAQGSGFDSGLWEIGLELVYVQNFNKSTGVATGVLRGYMGSKRATHPINSGIVNNPKFPRYRIASYLNDSIDSLYPDIFAIKQDEFVAHNNRNDYDLPASTLGVLDVQYMPNGYDKRWVHSKQWSFDNTGGSSSLTNKSISIKDAVVTRKIQVVYTSIPTPLDIGDDFSETGLNSRIKEIVINRSLWKLFAGVDTQRSIAGTSSQNLMNNLSPVGSATNVSKYFYNIYQDALTKAITAQQRDFPAKKHYI